MKKLDRKLLRDFLRLWPQVLAVASVVAAGAATLVLGTGAYRALDATRTAFYQRADFADLFASAARAPKSLEQKIAEIPGVAVVQSRIMQMAILDMEGVNEPVSAVLISQPDYQPPRLNRLYMRAGRTPQPLSFKEVIISEGFSLAHGLQPGDSFYAILNGRKRSLEVAGIALSPEYIYAVPPGDIVPDDRRFGVIWMTETALASIYDFEGAFNSLSAKIAAGADEAKIRETIDSALAPYGGQPAYDRDLQPSHAFLDSELLQLRGMSQVLPPVFLIIAAFLINMTLARMVALERGQIGLLKALGYGSAEIAGHYVKFALGVALIGASIGAVLGVWLGRGLTALYADFFNFPFLLFDQSPDLILMAASVCIIAACAGAWRTVRAVIALPAAEAMAPPAPPRYRQIFSGWLASFIPRRALMSLRYMGRAPIRTALTWLGLSLPVAMLVASLFPISSIEYLIEFTFFRAERQSATMIFSETSHERALLNVRQLPEVLQSEAFRVAPALLRHKQFSRRIGITGKPRGASLSRVINEAREPVAIPQHGVALSEALAAILHVRRGDRVQVQMLDGKQRSFDIIVSEIIQTYVGLLAVMDLAALNRYTGDGDVISGVHVSMDPAEENALYSRVKSLPVVAGIGLQKAALANFRKTMAQNINIGITVYIVLGAIMAFGIVYNSARIQLSERARELASLCVLGFTRNEVSGIMLGEMALVTLAALPLGWFLGHALAIATIEGLANELVRLPLIADYRIYGVAGLVVLSAASLCALFVWRRIGRFDLVSVLKTRE